MVQSATCFEDTTLRISKDQCGWDADSPLNYRPTKSPRLYIPQNVPLQQNAFYRITDHARIRKDPVGCIVQNRNDYSVRTFTKNVFDFLFWLSEPRAASEISNRYSSDLNFINSLLSSGLVERIDAASSRVSDACFFNLDSPDINLPVGFPLGIELEITLNCRRFCRYCAYNSGPKIDQTKERDLNFWTDLIDQAEKEGLSSVELTGGDPLTRRDIIPLLGHINDKGILISLNSDLSSLEEQDLLGIAGLQNLLAVQTTIDGDTPELHDKFRGHGAFKKMLRNVERCLAVGVNVVAGMIISKHNYKRVFEVAKLCRKVGIRGLYIGSLYPSGRAKNLLASLPSNEQLARASRDYAKAIFNGITLPVHGSFLRHFDAYKRNPRSFNHLTNHSAMVDPALYKFRIDPAGSVYASIKLDGTELFRAGDATRESLKGIWCKSPQLAILRSEYARQGENNFGSIDTSPFGGATQFASLAVK